MLTIRRAITALADPEFETRSRAAAALYARGHLAAFRVIEQWMADAEFASLLARRESASAVATARLEPDRAAESDLCVTVGIAVRPETFAAIRVANGLPRLAEVPPDQDALEYELHFPAAKSAGEAAPVVDLPVRLDILTTKQPAGQGAIAKFLAKHGEDIQQVEYEVIAIDRATQILRQRFAQQPVYPLARAGADGARVNFFLAALPGDKKILIELVEPQPKK
jgi:hypothetical protein